MSHHFHLAPADVWAMCPEEITPYLDELNRISKQREKDRRQKTRTARRTTGRRARTSPRR